jgi:L-lactate dehydrogenase complex protein LldG
MSAKENILKKVREALGKEQGKDATRLQQAQDYIRSHPLGPQINFDEDLVTRFMDKAVYLANTVAQINLLEEMPAAVAKYLDENKLDRKLVCWGEYAKLNWAAQNLNAESRIIRDDDLIGVTGVFCAIAETGTLMCVSGEHTPPSTSLLPETHIAIVPQNRIVVHMEDGWALLRKECGRTPRAVNFISGPSRTGDIEQTIVLGAHGPYRVHIIVVS